MIPKIHPNIKKQIYVQIGQQLKAARLSQALELKSYCQQGDFPTDLLQKLEDGDPIFWGNKQITDLIGLLGSYGKVLRVSFDTMPEVERMQPLAGYSNQELQKMIESRS